MSSLLDVDRFTEACPTDAADLRELNARFLDLVSVRIAPDRPESCRRFGLPEDWSTTWAAEPDPEVRAWIGSLNRIVFTSLEPSAVMSGGQPAAVPRSNEAELVSLNLRYLLLLRDMARRDPAEAGFRFMAPPAAVERIRTAALKDLDELSRRTPRLVPSLARPRPRSVSPFYYALLPVILAPHSPSRGAE
ncbi:hypothetical protein [Methylococcus capsulatus]|jgi:hypothetical protein|uniref:hypothetical protein n=1 Tax=Methylococcus capsulatus TaxID=414 RepID=UPI001C52DAA4|nr:hypothetical protein [Methylococcus capsulatus]QXP89494.1 hypothetical protein KW114_10260 [Methylococcus capsulatus]